MTSQARSRRTRWVATASTLALLGGGAIVATTAQAAPSLAPRTAEQLLVDLQSPTTQSLTGTIPSSADLGLPALPDMGGGKGTDDLTGLLSGDNTVRVWMDGHDRSRVSVIGDNKETTLIHNGTDVWMYSSADRSAKHATIDPAAMEARHQGPRPEGAPTTPQQAAEQLLAAIDPTTEVTTSGTARVAGRPAYELILTPDAGEDTLIRSVTLAIDAETHLVLDVTVLGTGTDEPALQIGFTRIDYGTPQANLFTFTAPPGTTVEELAAPKQQADPAASAHPKSDETRKPTVVGDGWDRVVVTPAGTMTTTAPTDETKAQSAQQLLDALPRVSGDWGSGRLLTGTVFSAVLTDDGRVAVGAVPAERLYAALR